MAAIRVRAPESAKLYTLTEGVLSSTPENASTVKSSFPGASFSVSSNGTEDGIAWAVKADGFNTSGPAVLYAFDAKDLSDILYESDANAKRDGMGTATRFAVPVVTNGKVYAISKNQLDVFGLFNTTPTAAAPQIQPNGGTFYSGQNVNLTSATSTAQIFYTLDDSTPTSTSNLYSDAIPISTNTR